MNNNKSLPIGFEKLRTEKPYINISKLPEGEHRFRIVGRPIAGWVDWKDNKPHRYRPDNRPSSSFNPDEPMRPFWAMHVWDYQREGLFLMEVTQNMIRKSLENYAMSEDWGDLTTYDIKIKKEGAGKETKYTVIPIPPKPISKAIKDAVESTPIRLEALYEGKDPWLDLEPSDADLHDSGLSVAQIAELDEAMRELNDPVFIKKIEERLQLTSIYNMDAEKEFEKVMSAIQKKIQNKELASA